MTPSASENCAGHHSQPDYLGRSRTTGTTAARHELAWILRTVLKLSYPDIATLIGSKDHTTAMYGFKMVEARIAVDGGLRGELLGVAGADAGGVERVALRSVA